MIYRGTLRVVGCNMYAPPLEPVPVCTPVDSCSVVVSIRGLFIVHGDIIPPASFRNFSTRLETFAGCTRADYTARARESLLGEPGPAPQDVPGKHVRGRNTGCSERHGTTPRRQESCNTVMWRRLTGERPRPHPGWCCGASTTVYTLVHFPRMCELVRRGYKECRKFVSCAGWILYSSSLT